MGEGGKRSASRGWESSVSALDPEVIRAYRVFRGRTGRVGRDAEAALWLAKAEVAGFAARLVYAEEDEQEAWDADGPAPKYLFCCCVYRGDEYGRISDDRPIASLGMVGVDSMDDPYLREVRAELFAEALDEIDAERDAESTAIAESLAGRATYAGVPA